MRATTTRTANLAALIVSWGLNTACGQQPAIAPFDPYAPPEAIQSQTVPSQDVQSDLERQIQTMGEVERLKRQIRLLELRVAALEAGGTSGTTSAAQLTPPLDDVIESRRIPPKELLDHPAGRRLLLEKWYSHGVFFCDYDSGPRSGEPISFAIGSHAKQTSQQAWDALFRAGAHVSPTIARDPDLPVHRVYFDANWSGTNDDLRRLQELENVVLVCCYYMALTDNDVKHLQPLKALTDLDLRHTGISDKALTTLAELKSLRRLTLAEENVTLQGVHTLVEQLPKLKQLRLDATYLALDPRQEQWLRNAHANVEFLIRSKR